MLKKPNNYEEVEVKEYQEYEKLELGGHICVIKSASEYTSYTGNVSLKVEIDTDIKDKQPNYFDKQYKNDTREYKKWSNCATKYISLREDETCVAMLRSFITATENSNNNFIFDWEDENNLKSLFNKKIVGVFGIEEYLKQDGTVGQAIKLIQFRSLDKLNEIKIPKVKLLNGSKVDYEEYINKQSNIDFITVDDNEPLPF